MKNVEYDDDFYCLHCHSNFIFEEELGAKVDGNHWICPVCGQRTVVVDLHILNVDFSIFALHINRSDVEENFTNFISEIQKDFPSLTSYGIDAQRLTAQLSNACKAGKATVYFRSLFPEINDEQWANICNSYQPEDFEC